MMTDRELMEQLFTLIQTLVRHMRAAPFEQAAGSQPITRVQWLILKHLHGREECTIGELAAHLNVRSPTMSQMIDRLEKAGLVYRSTAASDARTRVVRLTERGIDAIRQMKARFMESLAEPFARLTAEEHRTLVALLQKLTDHLPKRGER